MFSGGTLTFLYYICGLCGSIGIIQLAKKKQHSKIAPLFNYIGNRTLYILTFPFLAFKIVTYAIIRIKHLPVSNLSQFPVMEDVGNWMWIFYTIVGVAVPLMLWELFNLPLRLKQSKSLKSA